MRFKHGSCVWAAQLALVVCGSPTPWSPCPLERCGWTQDLPQFRQWLDAIAPSGGGLMQPLLAGGPALAKLQPLSERQCAGDIGCWNPN